MEDGLDIEKLFDSFLGANSQDRDDTDDTVLDSWEAQGDAETARDDGNVRVSLLFDGT